MLNTGTMSSSPAADIQIVELDHAEIVVEPWHWEFRRRRRDEIDRHFAARRRERPALWNGRVLLLHRYTIEGRALRGASFETDYASFLAWRDWGCADAGVFNIFAAVALRTADGAYLVGRMAPSTSIAGLWIFPCGTPDPTDVNTTAKLDLSGSARRELFEETGLELAAFKAEPGWTMVRDGGYIGLMKRLVADESAEVLRARIVDHLRNEAQPEFSEVRFVRHATDLDPAMPRLFAAYLQSTWS
jgi:8-oxo-dGTP pyrophosphatase MutT (NUDIX family)